MFFYGLTFAQAPQQNQSNQADETYTEDKTNINVTEAHSIFTIKLKSNPTTGYSWFLRDYNPNLIEPIKHNFVKSDSTLMGAPGYEVWVFRAKPQAFIIPQQTTIRMVYTRPWQATDNGSQVIFHVFLQGK